MDACLVKGKIKEPIRVALAALLLFTAAGCGSILSKGVMADVDRSVTVDAVQATPGTYAGRKVVWGGIIISSENLEAVTTIEVLDTPLAYDDSPLESLSDKSRGRFIIEAAMYLDTAVFKPGKRVTVAGVVKEVRPGKVGKMEYHFPVVSPLELRVSDPLPKIIYPDAVYPYGMSPYYPWSPYGPYGWPYGPNYPYPCRYPYDPWCRPW